MEKSRVILITCFLIQSTVQKLTPDPDCGDDQGISRGMKLSVESRRNQTGDWVDIFSARAECRNSSDRMNLDVTHKVVDCQGKRVMYIQWVTNADPAAVLGKKEEKRDKLTFHQRCGKNVGILANGRTVQVIKLNDHTYSSVFTNRPLKDNEIFEVKVDKKNQSGNSLGIGVITRSPNNIEILPEMYKAPFSHVFIWTDFYSNGTEKLKNYGTNINNLTLGDRVGVMRNQYGTLHLFVNGVDQGPAASRIPSPVFGVLDIRGAAAKLTIVDESSPSL